MASAPKTLFFIGATGGCGFAALQRCLEAGYVCTALCRTPSKLSDRVPEELRANLRLEQGNAQDTEAVARCLGNPTDPTALVDYIFVTLGGTIQPSTMSFDQPHVCESATTTLLEALARRRAAGSVGRPRILVISTTGITTLGRDVPLLMTPMYNLMLRVPHKDKKAMEAAFVASGELWTFVRPSFLLDSPSCGTPVRAGVEDPVAGKVESKAVGYTIAREDVGKWMFENLVQQPGTQWVQKIATITY